MIYNDSMKINFLKEKCKENNLIVSGRKADIISRLNAFMEQKKQNSELAASSADTARKAIQLASTSTKRKTPEFANIECSICNYEYNDVELKPFMITPCGHTYCKTCLDKIGGNVCPGCRGQITAKSENRTLLGLIEEIQLNNKRCDAENQIAKVKALLNGLKNEQPLPVDPIAFVKSFFANVKNEINLHYENIIKEATHQTRHAQNDLTSKSNKMLETLYDLEIRALNNIPKVQRFDLVKLQTTSLDEWDNQLKNPNASLKQIKDLLSQLAEAISNIENRQANFEHNLLMQDKIKFEPAIDHKLFGHLSIIRRIDLAHGHYIGEVEDGKYNGKGEYHWNNCFRIRSKYIGEWKNNKMHGNGILYHRDGSRYDGNFVENRLEGHGVHYFSNGTRYDGDFLNDRFHGFGIFYFNDRSRIEGFWTNGIRNGESTHYIIDRGTTIRHRQIYRNGQRVEE